MTYLEFRNKHFAGNDEQAIAHLAHESYYEDYSLTGSREELQIVLDAMSRQEAKQFMAAFKKEVNANRAPAKKKYAPLMDIIRGSDSSWKYDEEFLRKANPFGKDIKKFSLILLAGIVVILAVLMMFPNAVKTLSGFFVVFAVYAGSNLITAVSNYFAFRKAARELEQQKAE